MRIHRSATYVACCAFVVCAYVQISYIFYLFIHIYFCLVVLHKQPTWQEWYLFIYMIGFSMEKIREVTFHLPSSIYIYHYIILGMTRNSSSNSPWLNNTFLAT